MYIPTLAQGERERKREKKKRKTKGNGKRERENEVKMMVVRVPSSATVVHTTPPALRFAPPSSNGR